MKQDSGPRVPFWKSLRFRIVAAFAALAVLPFVASMGVLYQVSRQDAQRVTGDALAGDTVFLAREVERELRRMAEWADLLAAHPEVLRHAEANEPLPPDFLQSLLKLYPSVAGVELSRQTGGDEKPAVSLGADGSVAYRVPVTGRGGRGLGSLALRFDPGEIRRLVGEFRGGREGAAFLLSSAGVLAVSDAGVKPPSDAALSLATPWVLDESESPRHFLSALRVGGADPFFSGDWRVVLSLPEGMALAAFSLATSQILILTLVLVAIVLSLAAQMADRFHRPIMELHQGAEIISRINFSHRLDIQTGDELELLAKEFNHMAESLENAYGVLEARIAEVTRSLEEERNRLADVLRTMVEGLVVTNETGEALLMNPRARSALARGPASGIGVPLGRLLPPDRVDYHLRRLREAWEGGGVAVEQVLFPFDDGRLLRGVLRAMPGPGGARAGFLLVFRDVGEDAARERRAQKLLREMPEALKGSLSTVQTLADILHRKADLNPAKREAFLAGLSEEALKAVRALDEMLTATPDIRSTRWPVQPVDPRDLLRDALALAPGLYVQVQDPQGPVPRVGVEPYGCVAVLSSVLRWIVSLGGGWEPVTARIDVEDELVLVTLRLPPGVTGSPSELDALWVESRGEPALRLPEAVRSNRSEIWATTRDGAFEIRLALSKASALPETETAPELVEDQPEFYDFDLFAGGERSAGAREQLKARLDALEYVVFDTETTGLEISKGDRIVSLSGVRVRGGRVNRADTFHTLVHPGMPVPPASTAVHGITDEMVAQAPRIGEILPLFSQWIGDAVLVAHNAAFDKKALEVSAAETGQPLLANNILDTLFLSYGVHSDLEGHSLEAIAQRMGVTVEGRHTSLGDSLTTAHIFVQLLPLLASRGVTTLEEAKAFCDKMLLLRWQSSRF